MRKTLPHIEQITTGILCQMGSVVQEMVEEGMAVPLKKEMTLRAMEGEEVNEITLLGEVAGERMTLGK